MDRDLCGDHAPCCRRGPTSTVVGIGGCRARCTGVVTVDEQGRPTRNAILWADTRAQRQAAAYQLLPGVTRAGLANPPSPGMAGPILGWLTEHEPSTIAATGGPCNRRTGFGYGWSTPPPQSRATSATLLYSVADDGWDETVVAMLGIDPAILPMILPTSGTLAGTLTSPAASDLGLRSGLPGRRRRR